MVSLLRVTCEGCEGFGGDCGEDCGDDCGDGRKVSERVRAAEGVVKVRRSRQMESQGSGAALEGWGRLRRLQEGL